MARYTHVHAALMQKINHFALGKQYMSNSIYECVFKILAWSGAQWSIAQLHVQLHKLRLVTYGIIGADTDLNSIVAQFLSRVFSSRVILMRITDVISVCPSH